ncbi:prolipoprotein diacylglyceryl transferase [Aestuariimicrobium ganziense]|uniref:prolipoprotein diacylglyceryl transferase n=1 Tax=Aestuariimicrobium ganziense TaxID=2773677 RepID=UPI001944CFD1|nr:prolipoprotein diacylglyceryl transferase [Aestuariimicrobium ganziense]
MLPLSIPSPSISGFDLGPLRIHFYALCILAGIAVAWWMSRRRWEARGGDPEQIETMMTVAVLAGILGARVYHVATDPQLYFGPGRNPVDALKLWQGGLGIWGGVLFGALAVWWLSRRAGVSFGLAADVLAPGILAAQAIGRLGNWFNQELFGRPTTLPWALEIDPAFRPEGYAQFATFHPTFLYEMVWNLLGVAALLWLEKRYRLGRGKLFALYVAIYCFGRFFIEALRIDTVNTPGGFRLNNYTSVIVFVAAVATFVWLQRTRPGIDEHPFHKDDPLPAGDDQE